MRLVAEVPIRTGAPHRRPTGLARGEPSSQEWRTSDGAVWAVCHREATKSRIELVGFGSFELDSRSGLISGRANGDLEPAIVERRFWKEVVPMLHQANGALGLHASAVATSSGAVLLVGASGAGKSSLARTWSERHRRRQLADDVSVLYRRGEGGFELFPLPFYTSVWGDVRDSIERPDLEVTEASAAEPVAAVVFVERHSSGPALLPIAADAFLTILRESNCFTLADDTSRVEFYADNLDLLSSASCHRLLYPHEPDRLDEAVDLLADVASKPAPAPA